MTKKNTAKADIDFEKELWDAANELRGAVSENNYKNYILPLVFLKHLSERFDIVHDELEDLLQDPKSEYYTADTAEKLYVLEDPDEYRSRNTFVIPKTGSSDVVQIDYAEAKKAITTLGEQTKFQGLFGKEKDDSFKGSLQNIYQTFDGKDLYLTTEEMAAHLSHFVVKNHSFIAPMKQNKITVAAIFSA